MTETKRVRCVWCEHDLAPEDAEPIKYARDPEAGDEGNMQCRDYAACQRRQNSIDAALHLRLETKGLGWVNELFGTAPSVPRTEEG